MIKKLIKTQRTARYFLSQEIHDEITQVVFVLHGYAQNADDFLQRFSPLFSKNTLFVAPEGLSKFYWKDFTSNPSSSWMTSLMRLHELEDFKHYMSAVENEILSLLKQDVVFSLLGFSQGAAMASRYAANTHLFFKHIVMYAASPAHDLNWDSISTESQWHVIYGTKDWFINDERVEAMKEMYESKHIKYKSYIFEGKHEIHENALNYLRVMLNF